VGLVVTKLSFKEKDINDVWFDSGSSHMAVLGAGETACAGGG